MITITPAGWDHIPPSPNVTLSQKLPSDKALRDTRQNSTQQNLTHGGERQGPVLRYSAGMFSNKEEHNHKLEYRNFDRFF